MTFSYLSGSWVRHGFFLLILFSCLSLEAQIEDEPEKLNYIGLSYDFNAFDSNTKSWHDLLIEGFYELGGVGLEQNLTLASRFGKPGWSYEQNVYQYLKQDRFLMYTGIFSSTNIFVRYGLAVDFFTPISENWEVTIGSKFLYYSSDNPVVFNANTSNSFGRFKTSITPEIVLYDKTDNAFRPNVMVDQYLLFDERNFLAVRLMAGYQSQLQIFSSEFILENGEPTQYGASFLVQRGIGERWNLLGELGYSRVDLGGTQLNQFNISLFAFIERDKSL